MSSKPFELAVGLPSIQDADPRAVTSMLSDGLDDLRSRCRAAITDAMEALAAEGLIKRFTEITTRQVWDYSSEFPEPCEPLPLSLTPVDLTLPGDFEVDFVGYEVAFPLNGRLVAPTELGSYREPPPFLSVKPPWRIELYRASVRKLKTQDNFVFKVSIRLTLPLFSGEALHTRASCPHSFRLLDCGGWQWRLLWECTQCGLVCHCSCFQRAIKSDPFPDRMDGQWPQHVKQNPDQIPFVDRACEICRGLPSSHRFCDPQYAGSVFEAKYGAYLRKRLVELRLDGHDASDEKAVENALRKDFGFPPFGKPGFSEAELFRIVRALFPNDEVSRRVRPSWLEGLEIDIFVPTRSLAIEYHGPQHFAPVWPYGKEESFRQMQERDARKKSLLHDRGIVLCIFTENDVLELQVVQAIIDRAMKWKGTVT